MRLVGLLVSLILLVPVSARSQEPPTLVRQAVLGNATEDLAYVTSGPFAGHIAILDGTQVLGTRVAMNLGPVKVLFDLVDEGFTLGSTSPNGFAFAGSEGKFFISDRPYFDKLIVAASDGTPEGSRALTLAGGDYFATEGIAYIPPTSSKFADRLVMVTLFEKDGRDKTRLEIVRLSGQGEATIPLPPELDMCLSVSYVADDRLLLGCGIDAGEGFFYLVDMAGQVIQGPIQTPGILYTEGVVQVPGGDIVGATLTSGVLHVYDASLTRLPGEDVNFPIGIGSSYPWGLAWKPEGQRLIVGDFAASQLYWALQSLKKATTITDLSGFGMQWPRDLCYLEAEGLIAVALAGPGRIALVQEADGSVSGTIPLSIPGMEAARAPEALAYDRGRNRFIVRVRGTGLERRLYYLDRAGTVIESLILSFVGARGIDSVEYFEQDGAGRLLLSSGAWLYVCDLAGTLLATVDLRPLRLPAISDIAYISSGRDKGSIAMSNGPIVYVVKPF